MAAQAMRRPQAGGRYVWATVVVIVIIALFAGILALVFFYEPYMDDLNEMNENIESAVYNPLREQGVEDLPRAPETGERKTPWRLEFFQKVCELAKLGNRYQDFMKALGYLPEEKAVEQIEQAVASVTREQVSPRPNNMKEAFDGLMAAYKRQADAIEALNRAQEEAKKDLAKMTRLRDQLQNIVGKKVKEGDEKLRQMREKMLEDYEQLQAANTQLSDELKRVRKDRNDLAQQIRELRDKAESESNKLEEQVQRLEAKLAAKEPREKKEIKGTVRQADMLRKFAIVDLGKRENIKLGDDLKIYRVGRGGVTITKATGKVVTVEEFVSRVDLFDLDQEHPVIEGDIVEPIKKAGGEGEEATQE